MIQTSSKIYTAPYGKPAIVFTHEGGVEAIAKDLRQMLKDDFSQYLDLQRYQTYAQESSVQLQSQSVLSEEIIPTETHYSNDLNPFWQTDDLDSFWQAIEGNWFPDSN